MSESIAISIARNPRNIPLWFGAAFPAVEGVVATEVVVAVDMAVAMAIHKDPA